MTVLTLVWLTTSLQGVLQIQTVCYHSFIIIWWRGASLFVWTWFCYQACKCIHLTWAVPLMYLFLILSILPSSSPWRHNSSWWPPFSCLWLNIRASQILVPGFSSAVNSAGVVWGESELKRGWLQKHIQMFITFHNIQCYESHTSMRVRGLFWYQENAVNVKLMYRQREVGINFSVTKNQGFFSLNEFS